MILLSTESISHPLTILMNANIHIVPIWSTICVRLTLLGIFLYLVMQFLIS
jgi:hypothetical protein